MQIKNHVAKYFKLHEIVFTVNGVEEIIIRQIWLYAC